MACRSLEQKDVPSGVSVDSRPLYYGAGLSGRGGNWVDATATQGTDRDIVDENHHLAKVRVAGSNPVFRSILPGRRHFFNLGSETPRFIFSYRFTTIVVAFSRIDEGQTFGMHKSL
jgi:hypothetical protein